MNREKIMEYLKIVLELEKNKYETEQILADLKSRNYTGKTIVGPTYNGKKPNMGGDIALSVIGMIIKVVVLGFCGGILGGIIGLIGAGRNYGSYAGKPSDTIPMWIGVAIGIIWGVISIGAAISENKKAEEESQKVRLAQIDAARRTENNKQKADNQNLIVQNSIAEITKAYNDTVNRLERIYAQNIIYPSYRHFIAISSFYQYFDSGICDKLEGHDGAYSRYEYESRMDKIITKMDVVITKLDQIIYNQYALYSAIKEMTPQIQNITGKIGSIISKIDSSNATLDTISRNSAITAANSAITAYTTKLIAENQYYERTFSNSMYTPL